ncbi:predicted protein [Aspergillus nidulans FGSC A4]|uniref:Uncharacterized protein n=1 Tax=Emericella nidulans (strain FGSC A4 / ATCC 38163 / CBS 112.46 / NRRL 194 / M139) TaxID=227321 RepID=Q5BDA9_EMENI|nr:hypothetical protein [Aspergillus nidulans FGSC A4]EAA64601.1 predicted protein [Aspergillus nidulans FGSC A4]CBF84926.1 TPA: conserved hypothetical protein [Aspergillus nidulans FGSC A4]|eukprot:XP_659075.1 predicted protein [Aspergillus nidulans FGSC A4]
MAPVCSASRLGDYGSVPSSTRQPAKTEIDNASSTGSSTAKLCGTDPGAWAVATENETGGKEPSETIGDDWSSGYTLRTEHRARFNSQQPLTNPMRHNAPLIRPIDFLGLWPEPDLRTRLVT